MADVIVAEYRLADNQAQALRVPKIHYCGDRVPLKVLRKCLTRRMIAALPVGDGVPLEEVMALCATTSSRGTPDVG